MKKVITILAVLISGVFWLGMSAPAEQTLASKLKEARCVKDCDTVAAIVTTTRPADVGEPADVAKMTAAGISFQVPLAMMKDVAVSQSENSLFVVFRGTKRPLLLINLDPRAKMFRENFGWSSKTAKDLLSESELKKFDESVKAWVTKSSDEELFNEMIAATPAMLKNAGDDPSEAAKAYACIYTRATYYDYKQYSKFTLGDNTVYMYRSPDDTTTWFVMFNKQGSLFGALSFSDTANLKWALLAARTMHGQWYPPEP